MAELRFDGRTAVVTGGGRGMGRCHAIALAARGANVVIADYGVETNGSGSSQAPADEVVAEIEAAGGSAVSVFASVADPDDSARIVQTAIDRFGGVDILINNAGLSDPGAFGDLTLEQFQRMVDVSCYGSIYTTKAAWPHMQAKGYGRIIQTTSESVFGILPKLTSYSIGKGAVFALIRCLAAESAEFGILVNGVAPRAGTRMVDAKTMAIVTGMSEEDIAANMPSMPPELTSPAVLYLAHESCAINGEVLASGGGQVQRIATMETQGITRPNLTPEDIAEHLDAILDTTDAFPLGVGFGLTAS